MKCLRHSLLFALLRFQADAARAGALHRPRGLERLALARRSVDFVACRQAAAKFIDSPVPAAEAIEKAVDFCAVDRRIFDSNYACAHFKEGVTQALRQHSADELFDAAAFCRATEDYMFTIRGAARVPRVGSGPLLGFKVSPRCTAAVAAAFAPEKQLAAASVPDFWYALCMNQDCAHFLPSRTRWCNVQRQPTHSVVVCEAARKFALDKVLSLDADKMGPREICALYAEFVREVGVDVDAYEHVMHDDTAKKLPVPDDQARTLLSSQLVNNAKAHYIRDRTASPVRPEASSLDPRPPAAGGPAPVRSLARAAGGTGAAKALMLLLCSWTGSVGLAPVL